jgi:hypothetical protein
MFVDVRPAGRAGSFTMDMGAPEQKPDVSLLVSIVCSSCRGPIGLGDDSCRSCGREVTRGEKLALRRRWQGSDARAAGDSEEVASGRYALLAVSGVAVLDAMIGGFFANAGASILVPLVVCAVMLGLFFWSARQPLLALGSGLALFLAVQAIMLLVAPAGVLRGIVFKSLILVALIAGITAEWSLQRNERRTSGKRGG